MSTSLAEYSYQVADKDLTVRGKALQIYNWRNWGKNPYYTVLSKNYRGLKHKYNAFESIDNQYNWLGIDEHEAKKLALPHPAHDNHIHMEMLHSHEDWGNPQDRSSLFVDCYNSPFIGYHEGGISQNCLYSKGKGEHSQEIIAVNDSENEVIVPHGMEVHHLGDVEHEDIY